MPDQDPEPPSTDARASVGSRPQETSISVTLPKELCDLYVLSANVVIHLEEVEGWWDIAATLRFRDTLNHVVRAALSISDDGNGRVTHTAQAIEHLGVVATDAMQETAFRWRKRALSLDRRRFWRQMYRILPTRPEFRDRMDRIKNHFVAARIHKSVGTTVGWTAAVESYRQAYIDAFALHQRLTDSPVRKTTSFAIASLIAIINSVIGGIIAKIIWP